MSLSAGCSRVEPRSLGARASRDSEFTPRRARSAVAGLVAIAFLLVTAFTATASAAPGDLDPSFGQGGVVGGPSSSVNTLAVQPDGKLVAAGLVSVIGGGSALQVVRYNTDGSLDDGERGDPTPADSFGSGGIVTINFGPFGNGARAEDVLIQPDGKIVAFGSNGLFSNQDWALVRLRADGSRDSSFGTQGIVTTDFAGTTEIPGELVLQPDGKLVAAGRGQTTTDGSTRGFALARYNANGTLDTTFGSAGTGKVVTPIPGREASAAPGLARQPDGKLVVAGGGTGAACNPNCGFTLARYNVDGNLDTTFDGDGFTDTDRATGAIGPAEDVVLQDDGKIVATGFGLTVARYDTNGQPDPAFGTAGVVRVGFGPSDAAGAGQSIRIQPDGKIVVAGSGPGSTNTDFALVRLNGDGALDSTFGSGGRMLTDFGSGNDQARTVTIQADGKLVAGGSGTESGSQFTLARYFSSATPSAGDLAVTAAAAPDPVDVGGALDYTVRITNQGAGPALAPKLVQTLPDGVDFDSFTTSRGLCTRSGLTISCDLRGLASGETVTFRVTTTPTRTGALASSAAVTSSSAADRSATGAATAVAAEGAWAQAGALSDPRRQATQTSLSDGKVLLVGGFTAGSNVRIATTDLYDPKTNTWTRSGALATPRTTHTATLLKNGKVLVAGGGGRTGALASSELYDPGTGQWSPTGALSAPRRGHSANLLPDGRVLVTGGSGPNNAEIYDPATGAWATKAASRVEHGSSQTVLLGNGKALVASGIKSGGNTGTVAESELYDIAGDSWSLPEEQAVPRNNYAGAALPSGEGLVTGGLTGSGSSAPTVSTEIYDFAADTWRPGGSLLHARGRLHQLVTLANGEVMMIGGQFAIDNNAPVFRSGEIYDPVTGQWRSAGVMSDPLINHTASVLPNGKVLVAGGVNSPVGTGPGSPGQPFATAQLYTPIPDVRAITPATGPTAGGTRVTLSGFNFTEASRVRFGNTPAASVTVDSPRQITAVAPAGAAGRVNVTVENEGGASEDPLEFVYVAPSAPSVPSGPSSPPPTSGCPQGTSAGVSCQASGNGLIMTGTNGKDRLVGTTGKDTIRCGDGNDVVLAGPGNDVIRCGAGNDKINGGTGNDNADGEPGNDTVSGDPGNDRLAGSSGNDRLNGNSGRDRASGGSGKDRISGNSGNDNLNGGAASDRISGNGGNDRLSGGSTGNDRLAGNSGNDRLAGGTGNDSLVAGTGTDRLAGGPGNDSLNTRDRRRGDSANCGESRRDRDRASIDRGDRVRNCERASRRGS